MASLARRIRRGAALTIVVGVAALATATAASAHVTVSGAGATSGGSDQVITFRVPTESATASTTELQVKLPTSTPIASVLVQPHPGWSEHVTSVKLSKPITTDDGDITEAVSTVTWKANTPADGIKPGEFDEFVIIAGQLPEATELTFPTIQTYSDGTSVSWTQVAAPGSTDEPDHPAPSLRLAEPDSAGTKKSSDGSSTTAKVGVILGAIGVALGTAGIVLSLRRRPE